MATPKTAAKTTTKSRKNYSKILEAAPALTGNKELEGLADTLDDAQALAVFVDSDAGKAMINARSRICKGLIGDIIGQVKLAEFERMKVSVLSLDSNLSLLSQLLNAKDNEDALQQVVDDIVRKEI